LGSDFNGSGQLGDYGAVIFGHSWKFPLCWEDYSDPKKGDPKEDEPTLLTKESDALFHDSGIGSMEGSENLDSTSSQQLPSEGFSSELLHGPASDHE
jgi:hypothetical protein